jgi:NAD(P)-dependent dehydrogenase (short-subunit alcohol dehydrogenase family)
MLLRDKTAIIYGAGGAIGRAVAQAVQRHTDQVAEQAGGIDVCSAASAPISR